MASAAPTCRRAGGTAPAVTVNSFSITATVASKTGARSELAFVDDVV